MPGDAEARYSLLRARLLRLVLPLGPSKTAVNALSESTIIPSRGLPRPSGGRATDQVDQRCGFYRTMDW